MAVDVVQARRLSKFLSYVLRHHPEAIGLDLDSAGWTDVAELIARAEHAGRHFTRTDLAEVVATNPKQRFAFSRDGTRIRAVQGHSVAVELGVPPVEPPEVLYHGTAAKTLQSILMDGLLPMARQQIHLSADDVTAAAVGRRHGRPVVLEVAAGRMFRDGYQFYRADNGVWLTDSVPVTYLSQLPANRPHPRR